MRLTVKFFAAARDITKMENCVLIVPDHATPSMVLDALFNDYPRLSQLKDYLRVAVNWEYVPPDHPLAENDELAIIPPVSGG
ncbi:MAG: MoaD/ThiS family protein [Ignavibacteriae bacterium]|nr:MoaD/ThiS family protein [Ignavibacteria bacterium]MBI3363464.1 MoaD/ThiS family protein [Ignavibacteriota bacterium]